MRTWLLFTAALLAIAPACGSGTPRENGTGAGTTTGTGATASTGGAGGSASHPTEPPAELVPKVTGTCPDLVQGKNTFSPDGKSRDVLIWIDPEKAAAMDGPLVFFWHGVGGDPSEATYALGPAMDGITSMGGIV